MVPWLFPKLEEVQLDPTKCGNDEVYIKLGSRYWRKLYFKEHRRRTQAEALVRRYEGMDILRALAELESENYELRKALCLKPRKCPKITCTPTYQPVITRVED